MNRCSSILCGALCLTCGSARTLGQFEAFELPGSPNFSSRVYAISNGVVGGSSLSAQHPGFWQDWSTFTDLGSAASVSAGDVRAFSGSRQFGNYHGRAAAWEGTNASWQDLGPINSYVSDVLAADGNSQVGWYNEVIGGDRRAVRWSGTAASAVSLHPTGMRASQANAVAGARQGGVVQFFSNVSHAGLWSGTPESFIDMNPSTMTGSTILGMWGDQQVGSAYSGGVLHAALWTGTPESWRDLHPYPIGLSEINASCGSAQVGVANGGAGINAGIWFGTPQSFINLAPLLPPGAGTSVATCVEEVNGVFTVGGYALYGSTYRAFVWTGVPAPSSALILFAGGLWATRRRGRLGCLSAPASI